MLQDWQQRVVEEKKELDEKIQRLNEFLQKFDDGLLPDAVLESMEARDLGLLEAQLCAMEEYSEYLKCRIERFNK